MLNTAREPDALLQEMFLKFEEHFVNKKLNFLIFTGDRPEEAVPYLRIGPVFAYSTTRNDWEMMVKLCKDKSDAPYEKEQCF